MFGSRIKNQLCRLIFPPCCPFCEIQTLEECSSPRGLPTCCESCSDKLIGQAWDRCHKCGASCHPKNSFGNRCRLCHGLDLRFDRAVAIGDYRGHLRDMVIETKREHHEVRALQLGFLLGTQMERFEVGLECDLVLPVPTHWFRKFKRGFHAASVIADGVCLQLGLKKEDSLMICTRLTKKQGTLLTPGRFQNVRGAFQMNRQAEVADKKVLIVDDVMTSGATVGEVAKILYRAGASQVQVAVAARGAKAT